MDIDALRKINELTKALQQHKISGSSEDAWKQAETILQPTQVQNATITAPLLAEQQEGNVLLERKYKLMLEMNNKKFETMMTTMQENINTLTQEIARLKTELKSTPAKSIEITPIKQEEPQVPPQQSEPKKEAHPRQGTFAPGDVSIEKIFYFGHK